MQNQLFKQFYPQKPADSKPKTSTDMRVFEMKINESQKFGTILLADFTENFNYC